MTIDEHHARSLAAKLDQLDLTSEEQTLLQALLAGSNGFESSDDAADVVAFAAPKRFTFRGVARELTFSPAEGSFTVEPSGYIVTADLQDW